MHIRTFFMACLLCCCTAPTQVCAQQKDWSGFGFEANIIGGKVLKHEAKFLAPIPALSTAYDLFFVHRTDGRKAWQQRRHYPLWGIGVTYTAYGIDTVYGHCIGLYPALQLPIITGKHLEWTMRIGMGVGYISRHYERAPVWDTLNNAIGSHFDNFTMILTDVRYHLNTHWDFQAGLNFSHISNGAIKQPNLGVNMYGAHIGLRYFPVTSQPAHLHTELPRLSNRLLAQVKLGIAFNQDGIGGPVYRIYLASAYVSKRYGSRNKVYLGVDYSYHENIYAFLRNNEILTGQEAAHAWKSAVFLGNEFLLGSGAIFGQVGIYDHQAYLRSDFFYEKIGYNQYLLRREKGGLKELCLYAALKAHKATAELAEFGIGVGL